MQVVEHIAGTHGDSSTWKMAFANKTEREKTIEGWVKFRTHWREAYRQLSETIRKQKSQRKGHRDGYVPGLDSNRREAHRMMMLRENAKLQFFESLERLAD